MDNYLSSSPEPNQYFEKLRRYVLAVDTISGVIKTIELNGFGYEFDFKKNLEGILPQLREAFDSESAFYTDATGRIISVEPQNSTLVGEILPTNKYVDDLIKNNKPLVLVDSKDIPPELNVLGIQSLLIVPLEGPWGRYLIGVYNGGRNSGYEGDIYEGNDLRFFEKLMEILGLSVKYGHTQAEVQLAYERYLHAQCSGRLNFLSRASEDYAKFRLHLKSRKVPRQKANQLAPDDVLADYLDAELCEVLQGYDSRLTKNNEVKNLNEKAEKLRLITHLLSLVELSKDCQHLTVNLNDNEASAENLSPRGFPRTGLVTARICMWAGYIKAGVRVPGWLNMDGQKSRLDALNRNLDKAEALDLFYTLPRWLISETEPRNRKAFAESSISMNRYMDWLRTQWQRIHYLARSGIAEPRREWGQEIDTVYNEVRSLTTQVIYKYLEQYQSDDGLQVDSDWLLTWLISNILLSQRLADHYGPEDATGALKSLSSPVEKMRYFAHLSHLVLYTLHWARHLDRKKEMLRKRNRPVSIQPFPFADIPIDLSLSRSEAQLYLLSEYAYREIGVHRELVLLERLLRQLRYELPLYAASKFYRDHLYHVIDVCLLGELLLRSRLPASLEDTSSQTIADNFANGPASRELMQNWYVAALCHDLGYVVERASSLLEPVRAIRGPGLDQFWNAVEEGLQRGENEMREVIKSKLSSSFVLTVVGDELKEIAPTDHGVAAWLHLIYWLDQIKESPRKVSHALNAILRHNLPRQQVSFRQEPLTLLLMLCDHLQEWGRSRVGPDPLARGVLEALRFSDSPDFGEKIRAKYLLIKGLNIIDNKNDYPRVQTQMAPHKELEFELPHVEAREGDFEPAISWLLLCRDLQCFGGQAQDFPFSIKITLNHTPSRIWHLLPWQPLEMELLQEFASSYEPAAYLCEWVEKARQGQEGIHYQKKSGGKETFSIHLNELKKPLSRGLPDEHWKQFYRWKWRRLGQQFINLRLGAWFPEF